MKSFFASGPAYTALRGVIGLLFVYAGILKLTAPSDFAMTINLYGLVTWRMANVLAYVIPTVEVIAGVGLFFDIKGALTAIVVQLLGFMCVLLYALHLGLDADCGCFGTPRAPESDPVGPLEAFIRDGVMLAACCIIYWQRKAANFRFISRFRGRCLRRPGGRERGTL